MQFDKKIIAGFFALAIIAIVNYAIFFNADSYLDEVVLVAFIMSLSAFYNFVVKPFVKSFKKLYSRVGPTSIDPIAKNDPLKILDKVFEEYSTSIENATHFIQDIKSGNLNSTIIDANQDANNTLGSALISLRDQMVQIAVDEKERNWGTEGMARFVDILRGNNESSQKFYDSLITNIVKYLNANQGGFFLVNDETGKEHLSLVSCYAYERKKFLEKRVEIGEGLIGQAYLERETIFMKKIPAEYVQIRSGLGDAAPNYLLIVPFKVNDKVECIIELASFNEFKKYQIDFLEKLGESIASTVSNIRINENTKRLLEETQANTEMMKSQEEELRQSMEELEATQEEMRRKEGEMVKVVEKLSESEGALKDKLTLIQEMKEKDEERSKEMISMMEEQKKTLIEIINKLPQKIFLKDDKGRFLIANEAVAEAHHLSVEELLGKSDFDFFDFNTATGYRNAEIEMIEAGKPVYFPEEVFKDADGNNKILQTTKMPFYIGYLKQTGLLGIQTDITESKKLKEALKEKNSKKDK